MQKRPEFISINNEKISVRHEVYNLPTFLLFSEHLSSSSTNNPSLSVPKRKRKCYCLVWRIFKNIYNLI